MKELYQYRFEEAGREYQIIFTVDENRKPKIIDTKRLSPWIGSGPGKTTLFKKIKSEEGLSLTELEKLAKDGVKF